MQQCHSKFRVIIFTAIKSRFFFVWLGLTKKKSFLIYFHRNLTLSLLVFLAFSILYLNGSVCFGLTINETVRRVEKFKHPKLSLIFFFLLAILKLNLIIIIKTIIIIFIILSIGIVFLTFFQNDFLVM